MKSLRPHDGALDRCVTGPHAVRDETGKLRLAFRCELCGTESTDPTLREGCYVCDAEVGWQ